MAVTVDPLTSGDFTRINRADATAAWTVGGVWNSPALNTSSQVENTGCIEVRVPAGIGSLTANFTSRTLEDVHLRMWAKLAQSISAGATYGARLILGTEANHGSWRVYDDTTQVVVYNGWMMLVIDPRKPFDATIGTAPTDILTATDAGVRIDFVDGNSKVLPIADMLWEGNEVSVEGGTTGARGTFAQWATDDESNGYGILRPVGGVYYLNAGAVFQGVGTAASFFEDTNQVLIFEDLPVSGSLYRLRHAGNATGTNHFQLGTSTGTGVAKEGSGGGVIRAAGSAPFRIEAINADVDVCAYFGVTMLGPAALYDDQLRNVKTVDTPAGAVDVTTNANDPGANDVFPFPVTPISGDTIMFGHDERFSLLKVNTGTAGTGAYAVAWEYSTVAGWSALTNITDGTTGFKTTGLQTLSYAIADDWAKRTEGGDSRYWLRAKHDGAGQTIRPRITQCFASMAGDIHWEDPACEMIGCSLIGMGSIRVRNGAFLKKTTIDSSRAPAKHAAVDLGAVDPATDTFRDVTIQNCTKGILLRDVTRFLTSVSNAVDQGGGLVGVPSLAHGWSTGQSITIAGTANYDGTYTLDATTTADIMVITASFVAETFSSTDTAVPNTTYSFRAIKFSGNTKNVRIDFPATSTVAISVLENGTGFTAAEVDNVNGSVLVINNTVAVKVTCLNESLVAIQSARVLLEAAAGGPLPVAVVVTITRSAATATVAHTAHGMENGQKVKIKGADQPEYNGVHTISNVSVNAYDYAVSGSPATPATGTITVTGAVLFGLSDANGVLEDIGFNFSTDQPVTGTARKSSAAPFFKNTPISGTITGTGFSTTIFLVSDE